MALQPTLAGSGNVDTVYGPGDTVPVIVLNIGETKIADVHVTARQVDGGDVQKKIYKDIRLASGRTVTQLKPWKPDLQSEGGYIFEYEVETKD
jgi:hypothetical protein